MREEGGSEGLVWIGSKEREGGKGRKREEKGGKGRERENQEPVFRNQTTSVQFPRKGGRRLQ